MKRSEYERPYLRLARDHPGKGEGIRLEPYPEDEESHTEWLWGPEVWVDVLDAIGEPGPIV